MMALKVFWLLICSTVGVISLETSTRLVSIEGSSPEYKYGQLANITFTIKPACYHGISISRRNLISHECVIGNFYDCQWPVPVEQLTHVNDTGNSSSRLTIENVSPYLFDGSYYAECGSYWRSNGELNYLDFYSKSLF